MTTLNSIFKGVSADPPPEMDIEYYIESSTMCPSQGDFSNVDGMEINERNKMLLVVQEENRGWVNQDQKLWQRIIIQDERGCKV